MKLFPIAELRARRRYLYEENKRFHPQLLDIPESDWGEAAMRLTPKPLRVLRSQTVLVQVHLETPPILRLSICYTRLNKAGEFEDGFSWDELQSIKHQCGYGPFPAVEVFPADQDVVNVANMRHLWVFTEPTPLLKFVWKKGRRAEAPPVPASDV